MAEAGYGTITKDTPEADHLIDLLKANANQTIVYATVDTYRQSTTRTKCFCLPLIPVIHEVISSVQLQ